MRINIRSQSREGWPGVENIQSLSLYDDRWIFSPLTVFPLGFYSAIGAACEPSSGESNFLNDSDPMTGKQFPSLHFTWTNQFHDCSTREVRGESEKLLIRRISN
jgi:hypothetical protein